MKISLVIPVYNEAEALSTCLDAVASQSVMPDEVIVVDNNSSDETAAIAASYSFVTLLSEKRQGVVHARSRGFDWARGDIIARIDGDSVLPRDWVMKVKMVFSDPSIAAASGLALFYDVSAAPLVNRVDLFFRRRVSRGLQDKMYLWGANMAMRREAWDLVKPSLCGRGDQHEDFDIAIHLQQLGGRVVFDERLRAGVSGRRIDMGFTDFMRYVWVSPSTYTQHGLSVKSQMYPIILVCALSYLPGLLLYKGYDPRLNRFSLARLLSSGAVASRVDPTANVA